MPPLCCSPLPSPKPLRFRYAHSPAWDVDVPAQCGSVNCAPWNVERQSGGMAAALHTNAR
jgi:hypothetical protein